MDNNRWQIPIQQPPQKTSNLFTNWRFYTAYFITLGIYIAVCFFVAGGVNFWNVYLNMFYFCIPYSIIGVIAWAVVRIINKAVALGILLGSVTSFVVVLIATGGCFLMVLNPG